MYSLNDLKNMTVEQLNETLLSIRKAQFSLRLKKATGALEKTHEFALLKKAVAQIKTLLTEKVG